MNHTLFKLLITVSGLFSVFALNAQPANYYNGTSGKSGNELKEILHQKIKDHVDFSYSFSRNIMDYTDADPSDPTHVILFYTQESRDASLYGTGGDYINREHVWAKSHGNFSGIRPMDSDVHNLHPADASVNEDRSNKDFDVVQPEGYQHPEATSCYFTDSTWEPGPETKGQVARTLFYMATRYEGDPGEIDLELVSHNNTYPEALFGNLATLLEWNKQYPPSDFERRRNERLFRIQQNRNPFVDHPEFADMIWNNSEPTGLRFSQFEMSPQIPVVGSEIQISVQITADQTPQNVTLNWSNTFGAASNQIQMQNEGNIYSGSILPENFTAGEMLFLSLNATLGDSTYTYRASCIFPETVVSNEIIPILDVQGTGLESPLIGQEVTIAGRISANFDYSFYLQTSDPLRSGVNVYSSLFRGNVGDSLIITGKVDEYETLTEITDVTYNYNYKSNRILTPKVITTADIGEDYEGMLVTINKVMFQDKGQMITENSSSFTFSDQYGSAIIYTGSSSRLVGHNIPFSAVNITGILSQYKGGYQLLPRDFNDFDILTDASLAEENEVIFYPNPVSGRLYFNTNLKISEIKIRNLTGQLLIQEKPNTSYIDLNELKTGIYIVELKLKDGKVFKDKILKTAN